MAEAGNHLYYGDNLDVLRRKIASDSVDLCYIDPPFNSKRNYFQIYNNQGGEDRAQAQAFVDTWSWEDDAAKAFAEIIDVENLSNGRFTEKTVDLIKGLEKVLKRGPLLAYLVSMTLRLVEIRRVLKSTGSLFLHCDQTASHYLKLILDGIFCGQGGDLVNEIIWCYRQGGRSGDSFSKKHDTIFWYCKGKIWKFNDKELRIPYEGTGGYVSTGRNIVNGKEYKVNPLGKIPEDWWDIAALNPMAKERLGYPTQKPEAVLERIIKASSNEGDVILDAYCGCGTTVAVAQRLNRRWIGIDITYQSIALILKRLEDSYPANWAAIEANIILDGVPKDLASAVALANKKDDRTRKEFEKWAILTYSRNQARINEKKGADAGIDGVAYFLIDRETNGKAIFQVKSGGANRATLATLNSDRLREKAEFGILISMDAPTKAMREEIVAAGKYRHPLLNRDDDRIEVVTVEQILAGKRLDLPMARGDAVKSAQAVSSDTQIELL